jgi:thiamine-phosphate pyrophosphorylase
MCLMSTARREPQPAKLLLCYITDRNQFPGTEQEKERRLLVKVAEAARAGVDFVQLREKDLGGRALEALARKALATIPVGSETKLLINSRLDVALACGAHGVHLPAHDLSPSEVRMVWDRASRSMPVVGVSVHSLEEVALAEAHGADFALYGPVFEKSGRMNPQGLEQLRLACHRPGRPAAAMPLLALGGVTLENTRLCLDAGAAGVAGIRLFQQNDVEVLVERLRAMSGT